MQILAYANIAYKVLISAFDIVFLYFVRALQTVFFYTY